MPRNSKFMYNLGYRYAVALPCKTSMGDLLYYVNLEKAQRAANMFRGIIIELEV
jgi:hypothetical protein